MSSKVQLSGNEMLNKKVLSSRRKVRNDEAVRRDTGRVFQCTIISYHLLHGTNVQCNECSIYELLVEYWCNTINFYRVMLAQIAVMRLHVVRPSVHLSVRLWQSGTVIRYVGILRK